MVAATAKRAVVAQFKELHVSERRGCELVGMSRNGARYRTRRQDGELRAWLRAIAREHPRYGYRRACALLRRDGQQVNHKRVQRVWREEQLSLPLRRPRRRRSGKATAICWRAMRPNHVWTYDFVFDRCANGQKLKILTVVDEYTRESLAVETATSIRSGKVLAVLGALLAARGVPAHLRSDNGPEFVAARVKQWLSEKSIKTLYIEPGHPWENAVGESFNGRLRDECLNVEWFSNLAEAKVVIESWRRHYNEERPHSSLERVLEVASR
ncbi:MAG: IS3 family transposase [Acidobacteria bacterium]|nr:IS3 family transposase [Acidobacteriota bacterium]